MHIREEWNEILHQGSKECIFDYLINLTNQKRQIENQIEELRKELIKLHQKDGEVKIEQDGYRSILKLLPLSLSYLKQEYGIEAKDLPSHCFEIKETFILNQEKLEDHLKSKGIELDNKYTVSFSEIRKKIDFEKISKCN